MTIANNLPNDLLFTNHGNADGRKGGTIYSVRAGGAQHAPSEIPNIARIQVSEQRLLTTALEVPANTTWEIFIVDMILADQILYFRDFKRRFAIINWEKFVNTDGKIKNILASDIETEWH